MRRVAGLVCGLVLCLAPWALGQDSRAAIAAAHRNALQALLQQISATPLEGTGLTVGDVLKETNGVDQLMQTLTRSEQIGGPRWIDDSTCQIQLEIAGSRVGRALKVIVNNHPDRERLQASIDNLYNLRYSAIGASTTRPEALRPVAGAAWAGVPDALRRKAVEEARGDAISRVLAGIAPIPVGAGVVGDVLQKPQAREAMQTWLAARPVTRIEYRDDLSVELHLSATPAETLAAFRDTAAAQKLVQLDDAAWQAIERDFATRMPPAAGLARVDLTPAAKPVVLPNRPPAWIDQRLSVEGSAPLGQSRLRSAREAEEAASARLLQRVRALPLGDALTVGKAAEDEPAIARAVERAMARTRKKSTEYGNTEVKVVVELELQDVWNEIRP